MSATAFCERPRPGMMSLYGLNGTKETYETVTSCADMPDGKASTAGEKWQEVITASLPQLPLLDIVRICLCSKAAQQLLRTELACGERDVARNLLYREVQSAAGSPNAAVPTHVAAIRWLLKTAGIPFGLLSADSVKFINISNVPLDVCKQLVCPGVKVTKERLVAAVQSHVQRPQNWVLAHRDWCRPLPTTLPPLVEAVCCSNTTALTDAALKDVSPAELHDLLVLAIATIGCGQTLAEHRAIADTISALVSAPAVNQLQESLLQLLQFTVASLSTRSEQSCLEVIKGVDALSRLDPLWFPMVYSPTDAGLLLADAIYQRLHHLYFRHLLAHRCLTRLRQFPDLAARLLVYHIDKATTNGPSSHMYVWDIAKRLGHGIPSNQCMEILHLAVDRLLPYPVAVRPDVITSLKALSGLQQATTAEVLRELQFVLDLSTQCQVADTQAREAILLLGSLPGAKEIAAGHWDQLVSQAEGLWGAKAKTVAAFPTYARKRPCSQANHRLQNLAQK